MQKDKVLLGVASTGIAFLLWFQTQPLFEPGKQLEFAVPLAYEGLDDSQVVAITPAEPVMVVASGSTNDLEKLDSSSVRALINLSGAKPGVRKYPVEVTGGGVSSLEISPKIQLYEVAIERVVRRSFKVEVSVTGKPPEGLLLGDTAVNPSEVVVFGPESYFAKAALARVTFELANLRPGMTVDVPVEVLDKESKPIPLMKTEPPKVVISPQISAAPVTKRVAVNLNYKGSLPVGYRLELATVTPNQVELRGDSEKLAMLGGIESEAIDLSQLKGDSEVSVRLQVPTGALSEVAQVTVKLKIVRSGR